MLVEQSLKTLYQGVSRQPDSVRLPGQVQDATNVMMSVVTGGFETRPGTERVATNTFLTGASDKPFIYSYARDAAEKYIVIIKNDDLKVYDDSGVEKTITFPDGKAYLTSSDPSAAFKAVTVADRTIIANNEFTVSMVGSTYTGLPAQALINCRTTNGATAYAIFIEGSSVWTHSTVTAKSATEIADHIMSNLSLPSGYTMTRDDTVILIEHATIDFEIEVTGSDDTYGPLVMRDSVPRREHLPPKAPNNYLIEVKSSVDGEGYWAKYTTDNDTWAESADPYEDNDFDPTTMPHWLTRQADGSFIFEEGLYPGRLSGDAVTTPHPDFVGNKITNVVFHRNRLAFVANESVTFSQTRQYFTFWPEFSTQVLDSDSFSVVASGPEVNRLYHAFPFRRALFLSSDKNQFEVSADQNLTPETAQVDLSTTYLTEINCSPFNLGDTLYFTARSGKDAVVYEYQFSDQTLSNRAADVTLHALGYIPSPIVQMTGDSTNDMLVLLSDSDRSKLYIYKMYISGEQKAQSAWFCWDFATSVSTHIHWVGVIEGRLYIIVTRGTETFLERLELRPELADLKHPYNLGMDQQVRVTGTYDAVANTTTWTVPYLHNDEAVVVLSTDFAVGAVGERLPVSYPTTTTISAIGDYSSGEAIIGMTISQSVTLSKLFMREAQNEGRTITSGRFQLKRVMVNYQNSGFFQVKVTPAFRAEQTFTFNGRIIGDGDNTTGGTAISNRGTFSFPVQTDASTAVIKIENNTEKPMVITSINFHGFFNELTRAER